MQAVVIVSHRERRVDVFSRQGTAWTLESKGSGEVARVSAVHASIDVDALYAAATEPLE